jgi:hypothetical protein
MNLVFANATTGKINRTVNVDPSLAYLLSPRSDEQAAVVVTSPTVLNNLDDHYVTGGAAVARPVFDPGLPATASIGDYIQGTFPAGASITVIPPPSGTVGGFGGGLQGNAATLSSSDMGTGFEVDAGGSWMFFASGWPYKDFAWTMSV